jgi:hypothetical protein
MQSAAATLALPGLRDIGFGLPQRTQATDSNLSGDGKQIANKSELNAAKHKYIDSLANLTPWMQLSSLQ